jgi:hypothetical protein
LKAGLIGPNALDHKPFVFFGEAFCTHRRVGHPPKDEETPEDGGTAIGDEKGLPALQGAGCDESEAVG